MSDVPSMVLAFLAISTFAYACFLVVINNKLYRALQKSNDDLSKLMDVCDEWSKRYGVVVDDYNDLLVSYTRAYEILNANGLLPGDPDESDDQGEV